MKNVIVLGANGFIGSAVVKELLNNNVKVLAVVHNGHDDNLPESDNLEICSCNMENVSELESFVEQGKYDTFYHFAWNGSAGEKRADVSLQLDNAKFIVEALKTAKNLGCERFLHAGSIVEHETMAASYKDGNKPGMGYVYGCGKVAAHIMCMSVAAKIGIDLIWPEITNAYGPGERSPRLVNTTIKKCINGESPEFTAATQNYDFVYIDDVARAFRLIGENGKPFTEYLIGSSGAKPLRQFLLEMRDSIAPNIEFKFGEIPFTGVDLPLSSFDCLKTFEDTGFKAEIPFGEGCKRTMEWIRKDMEGQ